MTAVNNRPGSSSSTSDSERGSTTRNDSPRQTDDSISNGDRDQLITAAASVLNNGDEDHEHERDPSPSESTLKSMTKRESDSDTPLASRCRRKQPKNCLTEELEQDLFDPAVACKVVACCRVAPCQNAAVVSLVKRKTKNDLTLAIGDGANDVSMIQMADVGVGICGKEGR